jgi:hypothetical protein
MGSIPRSLASGLSALRARDTTTTCTTHEGANFVASEMNDLGYVSKQGGFCLIPGGCPPPNSIRILSHFSEDVKQIIEERTLVGISAGGISPPSD